SAPLPAGKLQRKTPILNGPVFRDQISVKNFRFHDTRHTAATRVLRKSNLRVVQELLGHEDIKTTTKYAHALKEDVRDALDAIAPTKSPTKERKKADKALKRIGKAG
ncbi:MULTISPECIES: tyrosine-type recombinase/integrase, partial [unclassified Mesorhizobium]|uniref:tyrosine-type recombinase/integrase n=1 Tax=unclassified Mesorhizobium TaxID=325217 RepID=UPI0030146BD9